jgi:hypothetical protein
MAHFAPPLDPPLAATMLSSAFLAGKIPTHLRNLPLSIEVYITPEFDS